MTNIIVQPRPTHSDVKDYMNIHAIDRYEAKRELSRKWKEDTRQTLINYLTHENPDGCTEVLLFLLDPENKML